MPYSKFSNAIKFSDENKLLLKVAENKDTPPEVLAELSRSADEFIRVAVALNTSTPRNIIDILSKDSSSWVTGSLSKRYESEISIISIHPTSIINKYAKIGKNVIVGAYTIIHKNVDIGDGTIIGSHCEIGHPAQNSSDSGILIIGKNSYIRSHSIFYEGSYFGDNLITGHHVTVREKTKTGRAFQIGTLSDIQGHCEIGEFVKFHSNVHIGKNSKINNYVWMFPYVVLTNDPHPPSDIAIGVTVEDYVVIATMSIILPGVTLKEGSLVGAHSSVSRDVEKNTVVAGSPAQYLCETSKIKLKDGSGLNAYPWRRHFHRGYLPETIEKWIAEFSKSDADNQFTI